MAPISSQTFVEPRPTTAATTVRKQSLTPHPGLPPVNVLSAEQSRRPQSVHIQGAHGSAGVNVVLVEPRVGSKDNLHYRKHGGHVRIFDEKLQFKQQARSRVGSLDNIHWTAPGGEVRILNEPVRFAENARSKVGSLDNISHRPQTASPTAAEKRSVARSRSLSALHASENIYRRSARLSSAAGFFRAPTVSNYIEVPTVLPRGHHKVSSKIGSLDNIHHRPGGGTKRIYDEKIPLAKLRGVGSKVGSFENITHVPGGGAVQIIDVPVRPRAHSKVGSLDNIKHRPSGGHVKIVNEPTLYVTRQELAEAAS
ncbi:hypothetical protein BDZ88DRAFT_429512 [Geranomyces variabilis]|nr:hypothetical protein BDZ88DRAFT_429512 [Geranomyces variabilis]KAJ3134008.1 hypothetical protein HDU90_005356 [Geranomyces variabilis]